LWRHSLRALVVKGPDPERDKVVRWRCVDLLAEVKRRFTVEVHESTIGAWLRELGLTRLQPRPVHPKKIPRPGERGTAGDHRDDAGRDLVPGRLSAEEAIDRVGQKGGTPTYGPKSARGR
jgi:hypothetical protein